MPVTMTDLIARVRAEIGDQPQPFRTSALGDGRTSLFDLPKQQLQLVTLAEVVSGASITTLTDCSAATQWSSTTAYGIGALVTNTGSFYVCATSNTGQALTNATYWTNITTSAYTINDTLGQIFLGVPVPNNSTLIIAGNSWSMFSDTELTTYCQDAINQHFYGRTVRERFKDFRGFIDYRDAPISIANCPNIEVPLVVTLATVNVFWTLANDTATDFNISTAEGTHIDRTSQYQQLMNQIAGMTQRYQDLCGQLNVGVYRAETMQLRRTSRTTGRLVPLFKPQEFDEHGFPVRELPPIDGRYEDNSGIPTTYWAGPYGV